MAGVLCLLFFGSGTPSLLYGIYQAQLRFPVARLTAVFAVYALVLLITLLFFGSVSDYLGRRRVILAALTVSACVCGLFLAAHGVVLLFAARVLQGVAVGAASGALRGADRAATRTGRARAAGHLRSPHPWPGSGRAGYQPACPVRAGANSPGLVAAAGR